MLNLRSLPKHCKYWRLICGWWPLSLFSYSYPSFERHMARCCLTSVCISSIMRYDCFGIAKLQGDTSNVSWKKWSAGKDGVCIRSTSMQEILSQEELFCRMTPIQILYHAILQPVFPSLINFGGFGSGLQYIKWKTCSGLSVALVHINYAPSQTGCN